MNVSPLQHTAEIIKIILCAIRMIHALINSHNAECESHKILNTIQAFSYTFHT